MSLTVCLKPRSGKLPPKRLQMCLDRILPMCLYRTHAEYYHIVTAKGHHQIFFQIDLDLFHPGEYQVRLECSLLNQKKILQGEILLNFALFSQNKPLKYEVGMKKDGISLGNQWFVTKL